jgi:hypothetical protein
MPQRAIIEPRRKSQGQTVSAELQGQADVDRTLPLWSL